jgi:hypothetical protein
MKKITEYSVKKFPSNIELFLYYAGGRLNMHLDLGILKNSKATIKEIQSSILLLVKVEPNVCISKNLAYEIAKKIKWYI